MLDIFWPALALKKGVKIFRRSEMFLISSRYVSRFLGEILISPAETASNFGISSYFPQALFKLFSETKKSWLWYNSFLRFSKTDLVKGNSGFFTAMLIFLPTFWKTANWPARASFSGTIFKASISTVIRERSG